MTTILAWAVLGCAPAEEVDTALGADDKKMSSSLTTAAEDLGTSVEPVDTGDTGMGDPPSPDLDSDPEWIAADMEEGASWVGTAAPGTKSTSSSPDGVAPPSLSAPVFPWFYVEDRLKTNSDGSTYPGCDGNVTLPQAVVTYEDGVKVRHSQWGTIEFTPSTENQEVTIKIWLKYKVGDGSWVTKATNKARTLTIPANLPSPAYFCYSYAWTNDNPTTTTKTQKQSNTVKLPGYTSTTTPYYQEIDKMKILP